MQLRKQLESAVNVLCFLVVLISTEVTEAEVFGVSSSIMKRVLDVIFSALVLIFEIRQNLILSDPEWLNEREATH